LKLWQLHFSALKWNIAYIITEHKTLLTFRENAEAKQTKQNATKIVIASDRHLHSEYRRAWQSNSVFRSGGQFNLRPANLALFTAGPWLLGPVSPMPKL